MSPRISGKGAELSKRKLLPILICVLVATALFQGTAQGHVQVDVDYADASSPLDIYAAGLGHTDRLIFGAGVMVSRFRNVVLGADGDFYVDFDTRGGGKADYYVWVNSTAGRLSARVYEYTADSSLLIGYGDAWRYDAKTVNFRFARRLIHSNGGYLKWYANTRYFRGINKYGNPTYTWDDAPDRGMKGHSLRVAMTGRTAPIPGLSYKKPQDNAPLGGKRQASRSSNPGSELPQQL